MGTPGSTPRGESLFGRQQEMQEGLAMAQAAAPAAEAAKNLTAAANDSNPAITSWLGVPGGWE